MFLRKTSTPIDINTWRVPGNSYAVTWSTPVHMNARVWEKANGWDPHPPDVFYPYRFLKRTEEDGALQFSLSGFEGSWIPFGSGANICPGRNFAKMHALLTIAMMVEGLECDVLAPAKDVGRVDLGKFGMGVIGPKGKVAVRIRKREVEGGDG